MEKTLITNILFGPVGLLIVGLLLLAGTIFLLVRKKSSRQDPSRQNKEYSGEEGEPLADYRDLIRQMQQERKQLETMLNEAKSTMGQLDRLIRIFDDTFFARQSSRSPAQAATQVMQDQATLQVENARSTLNNLTNTVDFTPIQFPPFNNDTLPTGNSSDSTDPTEMTDEDDFEQSPISLDELMESSDNVDNYVSNSVKTRREIKKLLKQGKKSNEIAESLGIPLEEVELVIKIIDQSRKVA